MGTGRVPVGTHGLEGDTILAVHRKAYWENQAREEMGEEARSAVHKVGRSLAGKAVEDNREVSAEDPAAAAKAREEEGRGPPPVQAQVQDPVATCSE